MEALVSGQHNSWRSYQQRLKRHRNSVKNRKIAAVLAVATLALIALAAFLRFPAGTDSSAPGNSAGQPRLMGKDDVRLLLEGRMMINITSPSLQLGAVSPPLTISPTIRPDLQQYLLQHLDRRNSRAIGIVALDPETGKVVAQVAFNPANPNQDPCLAAAFPAASVFKIVTAAAAIETLNLNADSRLSFNGYKHTLYKRQLAGGTNRYSNIIRFKDAFAQSVNPVFGKLGWHQLKKEALEKYATAFGFNKTIDFELPVGKSRFFIDQRPYNWAEVASGFNRRTTLSPLHGALLAACVINGGRMMAPSMLAAIKTGSGRPVYLQRKAILNRPITPRTARILQEMMETTIRSGTARRTFRNRRTDRTLSHLRIGGKTGSIYNRAHDTRYDWFVGWAEDRQSGRKLAVSAMVGHGQYIGTRAASYAKMLFRHYFDERTRP